MYIYFHRDGSHDEEVIMTTVLESAEQGRSLPLNSRAERPQALPPHPAWLP